MTEKKSLVIIGPIEVSGIAAGLQQGFRELGDNAILALSEDHRFKYANNTCEHEVPRALTAWQRQYARWREAGPRTWRRRLASICTEVLAWRFIASVSGPTTVILYMFGGSFSRFPSLEYRWIRARGGRIVFLNLGSDLRPPYMDGPALHRDPSPATLLKLTHQRWARARLEETYGDLIIAAPSCGHFLTQKFATWFIVGLPQTNLPLGPVNSIAQPPGPAIRILHAPSDPAVKGTEAVRQAILDCRERGLLIDYVELDQVTHERVLTEINSADILVDQVYSDLPMAGFGAEGAARGVPALVAGYFSPFAKEGIPEDLRPPAHYVLPNELGPALFNLIVDKELRLRLGEAGRDFVSTTWSPRSAAERIHECLETGLRPEWSVDPSQIEYVLGCGAPSSLIAQVTKELVASYGVGALHVSDKPNLEHKLLHDLTS